MSMGGAYYGYVHRCHGNRVIPAIPLIYYCLQYGTMHACCAIQSVSHSMTAGVRLGQVHARGGGLALKGPWQGPTLKGDCRPFMVTFLP
jgi:hypothetical protein